MEEMQIKTVKNLLLVFVITNILKIILTNPGTDVMK